MNEMNTTQKKPVGAVLVMGGGVSGMQATLDLVNSGLKVYMVEKAPGIGGKMAQLDKTFPTNDCSMCIVSPKLVEVGRHKDVELITHSDVLSIEGEAGDFTVKVRRRARYVDVNTCTGCGDCEMACPVSYRPYFPEAVDGKKPKAAKPKVFTTIPYREAKVEKAPLAWHFEVDAGTCKMCGMCAKACPVGAITWEKGQVAVIDQGKCIACGMCHIACPPKFGAITVTGAPEWDKGVKTALVRRSQKLTDRFGKDSGHDCLRCGLCAGVCHNAMGAGVLSLTKDGISVGVDACRACGACVSVCPVGFLSIDQVTDKTPRPLLSTFDERLGLRHAISIYYPQVVPRVPTIDADACVYINSDGEHCGICSTVCGVNAIHYDDKEVVEEIKVGSIILAPGFQEFQAQLRGEFGYGVYKNVISSIQFERYLSASGPTMGHVARPSDHKDPKRIAFIQCVGSRDCTMDRDYCSSVCCMYATKEAQIAMEHDPEVKATIFYIDLRAAGKGFDEYVERAKKNGVRYIRSIPSRIFEDPVTHNLELRFTSPDGGRQAETFDMVVLSVGLQIRQEMKDLCKGFNVALDRFGFADTPSFNPLETSRKGIVVCGVLNGTKDIPESVNEASGAAMAAGSYLAESRGSLIKESSTPAETKLRGDEGIRIGVFVCHCGKNIGGVVDVPGVAKYAKDLPNVVHAQDLLYACSMDAQETLATAIREKKLNRVVVAACSPRTHEPLFQETMADSGLNKYLLEFVNIRNHVSWVHKNVPEAATLKSEDLIRMAVSKVACVTRADEAMLEIEPSGMVIGGGISGMVAARSLSAQGYAVHIIERESALGGQGRKLFTTWRDENVQAEIDKMIAAVEKDPRITVHLNTELASVDGFVGNFTSRLKKRGSDEVTTITHGVAIVAIGAKPYVPTEFHYGKDKRVLTHHELDQRFMAKDPAFKTMKSAAFIQCVGSREPGRMYCSRVCCTHSVESALHLKKLNPEMDVTVFYRDIRTYGNRELIYRQAREAGVNFIRFELEHKPEVEVKSDGIYITAVDPSIRRPVQVRADMLTLANGIQSLRDEKLAQMFKVAMTEEGWFLEAHVKLGPSEFSTDGVFLCGMAHYPKPIDEAITQAQAAASRATTLLARKRIKVAGTVAWIDQRDCSACGVCVEVCPYSAPTFITGGPYAGRSQINPMLCKGCGLCVASCRSGAIHAYGFDEAQIMAQLGEAFPVAAAQPKA